MNHLGRHNSEATLELPENSLGRRVEFRVSPKKGAEGEATVLAFRFAVHLFGAGNRTSGGVVEPVATLSQFDSIF